MTFSYCHAVKRLSSLKSVQGGRQLLWFTGRWSSSGPTPLLRGEIIATQQPGTKLTIIAGPLRGRRCIHLADVFGKPIGSPVLDHAFRVMLVNDEGQEGETMVVGCHQVKVGW